jgi:four helix bundle protein
VGADESLIPKHGGYRNLKSFQIAQLVYDVTVRFCDRYIDKRSRTHDQMVQAARSGMQNIAEGSQASGTSKKMEHSTRHALHLRHLIKILIKCENLKHPQTTRCAQEGAIHIAPVFIRIAAENLPRDLAFFKRPRKDDKLRTGCQPRPQFDRRSCA